MRRTINRRLGARRRCRGRAGGRPAPGHPGAEDPRRHLPRRQRRAGAWCRGAARRRRRAGRRRDHPHRLPVPRRGHPGRRHRAARRRPHPAQRQRRGAARLACAGRHRRRARSDHKGVAFPAGRYACRRSPRRTVATSPSAASSASTTSPLSFVRSAADVRSVADAGRRRNAGGGEDREAAGGSRTSTASSTPPTAIMVARGDLGVRGAAASRSAHPARASCRAANAAGRPAITATQMLESMVTPPGRPAPRSPTWRTRCSTAPTR